MQISEFSFPHLHTAHDERLSVELERQRIAAERRAESATQDATTRDATVRTGGRGIRSWWTGRSPGAPLVARGPANEPCPTCP